jgi:hypothetical protein
MSLSRRRLQNVAEKFPGLMAGRFSRQAALDAAVKKQQSAVHKCDDIALYHTPGQ